MKHYTFIKTSELTKAERERVIDLYLIMFFDTEEGQIQIIEADDVAERTFGSDEDLAKAGIVLELLKEHKVDGVIVDDATEVAG
jgi:hypothetical protein